MIFYSFDFLRKIKIALKKKEYILNVIILFFNKIVPIIIWIAQAIETITIKIKLL